MNARLAWIISLSLLAVAWGVSAAVYPTLPERVPTHWNLKGEIDGYGPRWMGTFLMPSILIALLALFRALPYLSPQPFTLDRFDATYRGIVVMTAGLLTYLHLVILAATAGWKFPMGEMLMAGVFAFLGLMGGSMGKVRRNFYVGIRVPWTLASDRVWDATHRMAGRMWMFGGALGALLALVGQVIPALGILAVMVVAPIVYSARLSKRLEARGEA